MNRRTLSIETILANIHVIKRAYIELNRVGNRPFFGQPGVSLGQMSLLMLLHHKGRQTMGQLTAELGVSKGATTQLLEGLVEMGVVVRTQDQADRRVVYVELSESAHRRFYRGRRLTYHHAGELFEQLSDEELHQAELLTAKLAEKARDIRQ